MHKYIGTYGILGVSRERHIIQGGEGGQIFIKFIFSIRLKMKIFMRTKLYFGHNFNLPHIRNQFVKKTQQIWCAVCQSINLFY